MEYKDHDIVPRGSVTISNASAQPPSILVDWPLSESSTAGDREDKEVDGNGKDKLPPMTQKPFLIMVMGVTGSGKSNFIKTVTGDPEIIVSKRLISCTQEVQSAKLIKIDKCPVQLVDIPGFDNTRLTDTDILGMITKWMKELDGRKLHGILYFHRITESRMTTGFVKSLRLFGNICGGDFLKNTVMVTTMWDKCQDTDKFKERQGVEEDLLSTYWVNYLKVDEGVQIVGSADIVKLNGNVKAHGGAMYARSLNNKNNCEEIIHYLIKQTPGMPVLQREVCEEKKELWDTAAGRGLKGALDKEAKQQSERLKVLRGCRVSIGDDEIAQEIALLAKLREDQKTLSNPNAEVQKIALTFFLGATIVLAMMYLGRKQNLYRPGTG